MKAGFCYSVLADGPNIVGSCEGVVSLGWSCWGVPWTYGETVDFGYGYSFNRNVCGIVGVTGVWWS